MRTNEPITLSRDCEAIVIPDGYQVKLPKGSQVNIMQLLGGDYTVSTTEGYMVRISGKDADALGEEAPASPEAGVSSTLEGPVEKLVWDQLKMCFDPEIPVNIVDLGLIYLCEVTPLPFGHSVEIKVTLTAPGCGMGDVLKADIQRKVSAVPGVTHVHVEVVFEPPWNPSLMSEAAKLQLGML